MTPSDFQKYFDNNRTGWDKKTVIHKDSNFYNQAAFLAGESTLQEIELALLGEVAGKRLLHLQCHFGQDTISLARLGARCTGLDFSPEAIRLARETNQALGMDCEFVQANVYDCINTIHTPFELVFTSYGVLGWLPDIRAWAKNVAHCLEKGGRLCLVEFHPLVWLFDSKYERIQGSYFNREVITETVAGTYADQQAPMEHTYHYWDYGVAETAQALIDAGLQIQHIQEYDYSPYGCFSSDYQVETQPKRWHFKGMEGKIPMIFSIVASKI